MAISAIREIGLLSANMTDVNTALKNAGIDIAFVTVGGTAGKLAGSAIGSLILPGPGTILDAVIGGLFCGLATKKIGNNIKAKDLKNAISDYDRTRDEMKSCIDRESKKSLSELVNHVNAKNEELMENFNSVTEKMERYASNEMIDMRLRLKEMSHKCLDSMNDAYDSISGSIWYTKKYQIRMNQIAEDLQKLRK